MGLQRTEQEFEKISDTVEASLPNSYYPDNDVEEYHRVFANSVSKRSVAILWLEIPGDDWFELIGFVGGSTQNSKTFDTEEELLNFIEQDLDEIFSR